MTPGTPPGQGQRFRSVSRQVKSGGDDARFFDPWGGDGLTLGRFGGGTDEEDGDGEGRFPAAAAAELRRVSTMACAGGEGFLSSPLPLPLLSHPSSERSSFGFWRFFFSSSGNGFVNFFGVNERRGEEGPLIRFFRFLFLAAEVIYDLYRCTIVIFYFLLKKVIFIFHYRTHIFFSVLNCKMFGSSTFVDFTCT